MSLLDTLGDPVWMAANADKIKSILPETWTDVRNLNGLQLGFKLKLLGIDWHSEEDFGKCFAFFHRVGLLQQKGLLCRRAP